jgi:hypothetical protein
MIDTIGSKVVLILGRFTEERKPVLDKLRNELRRRNYLPVMFDFENLGVEISPRQFRYWRGGPALSWPISPTPGATLRNWA